MKSIHKRTIALILAAALGLAPAAWASEAMGHDIQTGTVNLSAGTELTHQIFWSDTYSDLRTERYFTYTPNKNVTPVVAYGDKVTSRETLTTMAQRLEGEGKRLVGGINGDLYVMSTGEPLGTVITDGVLRSVPGTNNQGYYAIGFRSDGTAFIGKPDLTVTATFHNTTFQVTGGINKVRLSDGMVLFTDDFGATTQNTQAGVDVILTPVLDDVGETVNVDLDVSEQSQAAAENSGSTGTEEDITGSEDLTSGTQTGSEADPAKEVKGTLTQSSSEESLPARHTDEIFAVCGEEFGLVGCVLLLALLGAIILRCVWVARRACSPQSAFIAMGYAGMLIAQVGVNVGMCLYVFPVVGITLPFISYGGSSILTMFAAMGIVSSIKMRALPDWLRDRNQL